MKFMNHQEIEEARERYRTHAVLGPATATLVALRDASDEQSDGWAYWPKPAKAARLLMELIEGEGSTKYGRGQREDATPAKLRAALSPIKAFRTRTGLAFDIMKEDGGVSQQSATLDI